MIIGKLIFNLDHNRLIKQSKLRIGLAFGVVYLSNLHNSNVSWWRATQTCWWEV